MLKKGICSKFFPISIFIKDYKLTWLSGWACFSTSELQALKPFKKKKNRILKIGSAHFCSVKFLSAKIYMIV